MMFLMQIEHSQNRFLRPLTQVFIKSHFRFQILETPVEFFKGIKLHEAALGTSTMVGWAGYQVLVGAFRAKAVQHPGLGHRDRNARKF